MTGIPKLLQYAIRGHNQVPTMCPHIPPITKPDDTLLNLLNREIFPVTIVNTNQNKIIRTEGLSVDGRLRKQVWGPANQESLN